MSDAPPRDAEPSRAPEGAARCGIRRLWKNRCGDIAQYRKMPRHGRRRWARRGAMMRQAANALQSANLRRRAILRYASGGERPSSRFREMIWLAFDYWLA